MCVTYTQVVADGGWRYCAEWQRGCEKIGSFKAEQAVVCPLDTVCQNPFLGDATKINQTQTIQCNRMVHAEIFTLFINFDCTWCQAGILAEQIAWIMGFPGRTKGCHTDTWYGWDHFSEAVQRCSIYGERFIDLPKM